MINLSHLLNYPDLYRDSLKKRNGDQKLVDQLIENHHQYLEKQKNLETARQIKNEFNKKVITLRADEKQKAILEMKSISEKIKSLENETRELKEFQKSIISKIPSLLSSETVVGFDEQSNEILEVFNSHKEYDFTPRPYWELPVYKKGVSQAAGVKAMGTRGYYLKGEMALFQKVLFDYALEIVLKEGFEFFYAPVMLNEKVLRETGHLPDFDGQMYETKIDEKKSYYFVSSSEPSVMGYFMDENLGDLSQARLITCQSSCFRKEAGSYGKDQQGILRVHQFEKLEMVVICRPEDAGSYFKKLEEIEHKIYQGLNLKYQTVEVCSGDLPYKHRRQVDFNAWFPSQNKFREISSNGDAGDYQSRGLNITFVNDEGNKAVPSSLNCTGITFRTGLAILEQNQQADGSVVLPEVIVSRMGKKTL